MVLLRILQDLGYHIDADLESYYKQIEIWNDWWKGYVPKFHKYTVKDNHGSQIQLSRKKMKMAKTVCEDWANLLLNDKTYINVDDDRTQEILTGDKQEQNGGILGASKFWKLGNRLIEKEFATGTVCMYLTLINPKEKGGKLSAESVKINYIKDSSKIVPLSYENGDVTEICLATQTVRSGKKYLYVQIFERDGERYKISNKYFELDQNSERYKSVPNLNGEVDSYYLPCKPFVILMPNIENNISDVPMGVSIYANAIDQLQGCDLSYDNIYNDVLLGKKRVFMNQAMFALDQQKIIDHTGKERVVSTPNADATIDSTLYVITGDKMPNESQMVKEYTPDLRITENKENIQINLNLLSSKVGLGKNRYQFNSQAMATATEVRVSNKDQTESIWKQRIVIQDALTELVRSMLILLKEKCGAPVDVDAEISIQFDDSMFADEETERMRFLQEIASGVRRKWEYRVKYLGEDEEAAKEMTGENNPNIQSSFFSNDDLDA